VFLTCGFGPLAPAAGAAPAADANWHQWRGPRATGVAPLGNPPTAWSETENVKWKARLPGSGSSTPIVWGNQVFVQSAIGTGKKIDAADQKPSASIVTPRLVFGQTAPPPADGSAPEGQRGRRPRGGGGGGGGRGGRGEKPVEFHQFVILSIDRATGKIQWQQVAREEVPHEGHHQDHGFASHSPITDGERVYAWFGSRGLHCYDLKGQKLWDKAFGQIRSANGFGEGNSPALHGNMLVINWDHEGEDFIAAFDKRTGEQLWRNPRDERTTWTTPLIIEHNGKAQVIVSASHRIRSYDLATGKQLWECGGMFANVISTPVSDFGLVFAMSGHRGNSLLAIKLGKDGDLTDSDAIAWRHDRSTPYVPSPLLYGKRLYFFTRNDATLSCFEATSGRPLINAERLQGPSGFYASPVGASGRVYLAGRNGTSLVLKESDTLEVLATNKLEDRFDASPAVAGNELFLRGHEHLYCIAAR
jgi:outer membrane protein assembly factor BamB